MSTSPPIAPKVIDSVRLCNLSLYILSDYLSASSSEYDPLEKIKEERRRRKKPRGARGMIFFPLAVFLSLPVGLLIRLRLLPCPTVVALSSPIVPPEKAPPRVFLLSCLPLQCRDGICVPSRCCSPDVWSRRLRAAARPRSCSQTSPYRA